MKLNKLYIVILSFALVLTMSLLLFQAMQTQKAAAVSGAEWHAGRIIDDAIFFNKDAMSVAQIQAFLNAKVPACDTNGTQLTSRWNTAAGRYYTRAEWGASVGNPAPFTCLKDYRENPTTKQNNYGNNAASIPGAVSAAQLIWNAAQQYGINPQVLLVLLQKEQSLITDDWPYKTQYNAATGAYCPDSGPGGSANCDSSQAGFSTQVYGAAALYDYYKRNIDQYNYGVGNNYILWNIAPSGCGGGNVYIENIATAMLYIYTPYQPNQAALNNLYGTGDGCSAYGNRNFWRLFNDWFGSTLGSLVRTTDSGTLYYTDGTRRFLIGSMNLAAEFGFGLGDVRFISQQEMSRLELGLNGYSNTLNYIVKSISDSDSDGGTVYLISSGRRIKIPNMETFYSYGFSTDEISYVPLSLIEQKAPYDFDLSQFVQAANSYVYSIESGKKRRIFEITTFLSLSQGKNALPLSNFIIGRFDFGAPYIEGDATLSMPNGAIMLYHNGVALKVSSMTQFNCWRLEKIKMYKVQDFSVLGQLQSNPKTLSCIAKKEDGSIVLADKDQLILLNASYGFDSSISIGNSMSSRIAATAKELSYAVRDSSTGAVFYVDQGKRMPIKSMEIYYLLGLTDNQYINISQDTLGTIPLGSQKLAAGIPVVENDGRVSVVTGASERRTISTMSRFVAFGLDKRLVYRVSSEDLSPYDIKGELETIFTTDSTQYLIDQGKRYTLTGALATKFGVNIASLPVYGAVSISHLSQGSLSTFIKASGSDAIYMVDSGKKRPISTWTKLVELGGSNQITILSQMYINSIPTGAAL